MSIKVSVIIVCEDQYALNNKCIASFQSQRLNDVELLYMEGKKYQSALDKATGKFILFVTENDTADQDLLETAVRCGEESDAEIVLLPAKRFDIETGKVSDAVVYEPCLERKLFRREYINNNFQYILKDDIAYGKYIGLSLLAGAEKICTMHVSRLYSRDDQKVTGDEILENYNLLYEDLCIRNKWIAKKQKFTNWLLSDISLWLNGTCLVNDTKHIFQKINTQLLAKLNISDFEKEYYTSEQSRDGARWIDGIAAGESFAIKHNTNYENVPIHLVKEGGSHKIPLISIIMPVFNVDHYLNETLDSLKFQTFTDFELICVDDGSTDQSLEILIQCADKDSRISVYQQSNCGQSVARNRALQYALGKYIYFMDSDDILQKTALEMLYEKCEQDNLDVLYFDGGIISDLPEEHSERKRFETYYKRVGKYSNAVYKGADLMQKMWMNGEYRVSPCLQFIKRSHLTGHQICFHQGIIHEDNIFSFLCMINAERTGYYGIELFRRRIRSGSTMTKKSTFENVYGYLSCYIDILNWLQVNDLADKYYQTVHALLDSLIHSAKYQYSLMNPSERLVIHYLKPYEQTLCQKLIVEDALQNI